MTAEDCDEFAMSSDLSNAELNPELRSIGCGWRLDELAAQAIEDSLKDCGVDPNSSPYCPGNDGMDEGYDAEDPDLNVGPDGYCTATPCGSNGTMPELSCAELGVEEQFCQPDGTYQP